MTRYLLPAFSAMTVALLLSACSNDNSGRAMGSLERDRLTLTAPVSETIAQVQVSEGQAVNRGDALLQLDSTKAQATVSQQQAILAQASARLAELQSGARAEERQQAGARVAGARAELLDATQQLQRARSLRDQNMAPQADVDSAKARRDNAAAQLTQAEQALLELRNGTRVEQLEQAAAAVDAARATLTSAQKSLADLTLSAPADAVVDILPWHSGDRVTAGSILVTLLSSRDPYARVYLPQNHLTALHKGSQVLVRIDGLEQPVTGTIRNIRAQPAFTPYYALNERDRAHLMYLTDIVFSGDALQQVTALPSGRTLEVLLP